MERGSNNSWKGEKILVFDQPSAVWAMNRTFHKECSFCTRLCSLLKFFLLGESAQDAKLWAKLDWAWLVQTDHTEREVTFKIKSTVLNFKSSSTTLNSKQVTGRKVTFNLNSNGSIYWRGERNGMASILWRWKVTAHCLQRRSLEMSILWWMDKSDQTTPETSLDSDSRLDSCRQLLQWSVCREKKETGP